MQFQEQDQEEDTLLDQYQTLEAADSQGQLGSEFTDHQFYRNVRTRFKDVHSVRGCPK